ncbi:AcrR family transcriptional regulator [Rubricella aquisinus]|uniref:AcrR family transcriptional regulator n=1 Tax=Rubricella aquisinus TaxID=2028108 RepID=A0A840X3D8_9RHOB|nr:TetR/AcrR family transcriptional regulator [Rubricella aquisinus]MBB5516336.1 AcrR family transcriptional regulator [Rubricella aquisinus]
MARKSGSSGEKTAIAVREAAIRLIAQHGFAAVSMRQIAREVGVQAGALYLYTPDKQSLLFDILKSHMEDLLSSWQDEAPGSDMAPEARLERFVRFHIRYHISRQDRVFISYMELRNLSPDNFVEIERLRRLYEDVLGEILSDGAAKGVFVMEDIRVTTMAMIAMLTGVSTWFREGGRLGPDDIAAHYISMSLRLAGAHVPMLAVAE